MLSLPGRKSLGLLGLTLAAVGCAVDGGGNSATTPTTATQEFIDPDKATIPLDRVGRPGVNAILIPPAVKDDFNGSIPLDDGRYAFQVRESLARYGNGLTDIDKLTATFLPDVLILDTVQPTAYARFNGRGLTDDAMDSTLQWITGNPGAGDFVSFNDVKFQIQFPFLAPPHP